jgi:hypothetical protein
MEKNKIGILNEMSLHAAVKQIYAKDQENTEKPIDGFYVDIISGKQIIEIQTGYFYSIRKKLLTLLDKYKVKLVYPLIIKKYIITLDADRKTILYKRKSPKKQSLIDIVDEVLYIPALIKNPNFTLEVLLISAEEIRCKDGKGSWRRKGVSIVDYVLKEIHNKVLFSRVSDFKRLLPPEIEQPFTNSMLAQSLNISTGKAIKLSYCLKYMNLIKIYQKKGNTQFFVVT